MRLVVYPGNPLDEISQADLQRLLSGEFATWAELAPGAGFEAPLEVWRYPEGDDLALALDKIYPAWASSTWLAPDPQAVLESVANNKGGLGFVPQSWLAAVGPAVKTISLPPETAPALHLPITAHTASEPQGELRVLLACVTDR